MVVYTTDLLLKKSILALGIYRNSYHIIEILKTRIKHSEVYIIIDRYYYLFMFIFYILKPPIIW